MIEYFPTLTSASIFDKMLQEFNRWDDVYTSSPYPYNVRQKKDGTIILEFALAGFRKDDINLKIVGDELTIKAEETKQSDVEEDEKYLHRGIAKRVLQQRFKLSGTIDKKKINSSFEDGLLTVSIPILKEELIDVKIN